MPHPPLYPLPLPFLLLLLHSPAYIFSTPSSFSFSSYGDTSYGVWEADQFGNPSYHWLGGIPSSSSSSSSFSTPPNTSSPTIYITQPTILHSVGNDRLKALVLSDGTVTIRQDEGGPKLLQGFTANATVYQFLGGIGYLANASHVLIATAINTTIGIGTPSPNPLTLVLGMGMVTKTVGKPIPIGTQTTSSSSSNPSGGHRFTHSHTHSRNNHTQPSPIRRIHPYSESNRSTSPVEQETTAYIQLTHTIVAPFGDDSVVVSLIDAARWAGPYPSFESTKLSWTEVWGNGDRYEMGWGADGYPVSSSVDDTLVKNTHPYSFSSSSSVPPSSSTWQQRWIHSYQLLRESSTGNVIGMVDTASLAPSAKNEPNQHSPTSPPPPPPPPGLPPPSPHDPSPRPTFFICLSCVSGGDLGFALAQLHSYTSYGSNIFACNSSSQSSLSSPSVDCPVVTNTPVLYNDTHGLNNDTSSTDNASTFAMRITFRMNLNTTTAPSGSVVYSNIPGAVRLGFLTGYLTEEEEASAGGNITTAVLTKIGPYIADPHRQWNLEDETTADAWAGYSNTLMFASSTNGNNNHSLRNPVPSLGKEHLNNLSSTEAIVRRVHAAVDPRSYAQRRKRQRKITIAEESSHVGVAEQQSWTSWEGRESAWHSYMLRAGVGLTYDSFYGGHTMNQNGNYLFISGQNAAARDPLGYAGALVWTGPSATPYVLEVLNLTMRGKRVATDTNQRPGGSIQWGNAAFGMDSSATFNQSDTELYFLLTLAQYILSTRDTVAIRTASVPWNGTVTSLAEAAWASYCHLETVIGTGEHGILRLLLSDHNDGLLSSLQAPESPTIMQYAESVMNAGLASYVLPQYADALLLLNDTFDAPERAARVNAFADNQRSAAGTLAWSEVTNSSGTFGWYRRAFLGNASNNMTGWRGDVVGDGTMWTETQSWAILGNIPYLYGGPTKVDNLIALIQSIARNPSPIGAINTPPHVMVDGGVGYGGVWYCGEVALISALASAGYYDEALDEYRKTSLATHSYVYPNIWFGSTSGTDVYNSVYAITNTSTDGSGPGSTRCHWNDHGQSLPCEELSFPIFNGWSHTVGTYTIPSLFGAVFDRYGLTLSPQLQSEEYYALWTPLVSVVKLSTPASTTTIHEDTMNRSSFSSSVPTSTGSSGGSCNYLGHWSPYLPAGTMVNLRILFSPNDTVTCNSLRVNEQNVPLIIDPVTHAIIINATVVGIDNRTSIITWETSSG